MTNYERNGSPW